jgi:hypothetical protein
MNAFVTGGKPDRWYLAFIVVGVHTVFALSALAIVHSFSSSIHAPAVGAVVTAKSAVSKKDVCINIVLLLLFGIQHLFAFPVVRRVEVLPEEKESTFDFDSWLRKEVKRCRSVVCLIFLCHSPAKTVAVLVDTCDVDTSVAMASSRCDYLGFP